MRYGKTYNKLEENTSKEKLEKLKENINKYYISKTGLRLENQVNQYILGTTLFILYILRNIYCIYIKIWKRWRYIRKNS